MVCNLDCYVLHPMRLCILVKTWCCMVREVELQSKTKKTFPYFLAIFTSSPYSLGSQVIYILGGYFLS